MPSKAPELIITRNMCYARNLRRMLILNFILFTIFCLLVGFAIYQNKTLKPMPRYFPTTPDGRLISTPEVEINHLLLSKQIVSPKTGKIKDMPEPAPPYNQLEPEGEHAIVFHWASLAIMAMFDYDYVNYRKSIQDVRSYFTAPGHVKFIEALDSSKNLETVRSRKAVVVPKIIDKIKLIRTYTFFGHYCWDIKIPIQLNFENAESTNKLVLIMEAELSIARISTLKSPFYGLAIYKLNFTQRL